MSYTKNSITILIPTGGIIAYTGSKAQLPGGWLVCDGAAYSRTQYTSLYSVIGTTYGTGDGTTTFNVPNFQAAFLRGAGSQTYSTISYGNSDRVINSAQRSALQTHIHSITDPGHEHSVTDPGHDHNVTETTHTHASTAGGLLQDAYPNGNILYQSGSGAQSKVNFNTDASSVGTNFSINNNNINITSVNNASTNITSTNNSAVNPNANESIPFNYAINWIIKC
jgi:microcystin-dependent protein